MNYTAIQQSIATYGPQLITMFGTVNPYFGAAIAVLIVGGLGYLAYKAKVGTWENNENQSGSTTNTEVGNDQNTTNSVLDSGSGFLGGQGSTGAAGATGMGQK